MLTALMPGRDCPKSRHDDYPVFHGRFVQKTEYSNLWSFAGALAGAMLLGPGLCSYLCPLDSIQERTGGPGKRVFRKRYNRFVPKGTDRTLGYLRFAVLSFIVVQTTRFASLVFSRFDPCCALVRFWSGEVHVTALAMLGALPAASFLMERTWCRWLFPLGVFAAATGKLARPGDCRPGARCGSGNAAAERVLD